MTGRVTAHDGVATGSAIPFLGRRYAWLAGAALILVLLTAGSARAADPTDSILTYGCDPPLPRTATNCAIWHTSPVNLRWTLVDPNFTPVPGSSCDTTSLSQDTQGTDVTCAVQDASSTQVQKTVRLRVDQTPPSITGATPGRAADNAGWWNHAVAWVFAGSDATSGISGCDTVTYSGPDSASGDVAGACRDNAGNSTTGHTPIKYDATAPTVTGATAARAADRAGWWNHSVAWTFAGTDATSGIAGCDTTTYSGPDSSSGDVAGACRDNAGNSTTGHAAIKYDGSAPTVTGATPARAADRAGWWNHSVQWTYAGTDATSGILSCDQPTYSGPDTATGDVTGACRDNAGNSTTGHAAIKYDGTAPTVTGATPGRAADKSGWWNHAVTWTFAGTDATSGILSCDAPTYSGPDSATGDVAGACRDNAGNSTTGHAAIKYDGTAPTITSITPARPADNAGWWNHAVKWTFAGSDATSGLASCDAPTYSGPDSATGDVAGDCRDNAGNSITGHAVIKYDDAPPTLGAPVPSRPPDLSGWWNHPVGITFTATDSVSGVTSCDSVSYTGPDDAGADVTGNCRDAAGNVAGGDMPVKYDATPPTITSVTTARPADSDGWWNHPVDVRFAGSDATSGITGCDTVTYSGPDTAAHDVAGSCSDAAGNSSSATTPINYDATPPTITSITPDRPPDYAGWWNHPVKVEFAGSDAMSGLAYCDTIVYSGSDTASNQVTGNCADNAGNIATGSLAVKYDDQPPALTALPADAGSELAIIRWSTSPDTVSTQVTRSPGIGDAPVSTVYSGTGTTFTDPSVKNDQTYTYSINARDAANNLASVTVTVTPHADPVPTPDTFVAVAPDAQPAPPPPTSAEVRLPLGPPRLEWRRVTRATYYNVQLFRGKKKILSRWPRSTHLQLPARWTFNGRVMRLTPGTYRWYVWPGFGKRSAERYGRLLVKRQFTVPASNLPD